MFLSRKLITAAVVGLGGLSLTIGATPAPKATAAPTTQPKTIGGQPNNPGTDAQRYAEVPELRRIRKELETIDGELGKDVNDPTGYRKQARDAVRKAIDAVNSEVEEYDKDKPK
ncbi:MAG TPA: hypothetical protein VLI90_14545 [Tepidisphaeraceae bacterium]|nr:hypothetical protein [Tepidisphaeraceae bacterium]